MSPAQCVALGTVAAAEGDPAEPWLAVEVPCSLDVAKCSIGSQTTSAAAIMDVHSAVARAAIERDLVCYAGQWRLLMAPLTPHRLTCGNYPEGALAFALLSFVVAWIA